MSNTKQILILNTSGLVTTFTVDYDLPQVHDYHKQVSSGLIVNSIFRIVEVPKTAMNLSIAMYVLDSAGKKNSLGQVTLKDAVNASYEIYSSLGKINYRNVSLPTFSGAFSFFGINNSSKIIRARFIYTIGKEGKQYVTENIKKNEYFGYIVPGNNGGTIQVKIEYTKDVTKNLWYNVYTGVLSKETFPQQHCFDIQNSISKDVKVKVMDCSKA